MNWIAYFEKNEEKQKKGLLEQVYNLLLMCFGPTIPLPVSLPPAMPIANKLCHVKQL